MLTAHQEKLLSNKLHGAFEIYLNAWFRVSDVSGKEISQLHHVIDRFYNPDRDKNLKHLLDVLDHWRDLKILLDPTIREKIENLLEAMNNLEEEYTNIKESVLQNV